MKKSILGLILVMTPLTRAMETEMVVVKDSPRAESQPGLHNQQGFYTWFEGAKERLYQVIKAQSELNNCRNKTDKFEKIKQEDTLPLMYIPPYAFINMKKTEQ